MKILVECPVCENRFPVDPSQTGKKTTECELCKNSFEIKPNRIEKPAPAATSAKPAPKRSGPREPAPAPSGAPVVVPMKSEDSAQPDFAVSRSTQARALIKRKKKSPLVPILLGIATVASAGTLIAVIQYAQPFKTTPKEEDQIALNAELDPDKTDAQPEATARNTPDNPSPDPGASSTIFRTEGQSDEVEEPPTNSPPDKPPKTPSYRRYPKSDVEDLWDAQFWHFVRLRVKTADESHYVSGTIVDSRGWVVTSLSAVANAVEIEVQLADKNLKEFNGVRLDSTDLVRGVIKTDPKSDLVLLAINRKLVISPSSVEFGSTDSMVAAQYLVQFACPGSENWAWPTETQISQRAAYDEMDFDFKSQMDEISLEPSTRYLVHKGYTDTALGAALFTVDGKLAGINTSVSDQSTRILATPVESVVDLISSSTDDVMGLSTLSN